jgi:hypothetical protein
MEDELCLMSPIATNLTMESEGGKVVTMESVAGDTMLLESPLGLEEMER